MDVSRARRSTSASNSCVNRERVRAHGTCSTRTPQCRHRTRRTVARTKVGTPHPSRCRHSRAGLTSWMRFLVSQHPEQIADARVGSRCTSSPWSLRVTSTIRQPLATNSCPVRMRKSTLPIRKCRFTPRMNRAGCSLRFRCARRGPCPSAAIAANCHAPRRGPGAPKAPSEASLPWTAPQAAWHHAAMASAALAITPRRPSPESANTQIAQRSPVSGDRTEQRPCCTVR